MNTPRPSAYQIFRAINALHTVTIAPSLRSSIRHAAGLRCREWVRPGPPFESLLIQDPFRGGGLGKRSSFCLEQRVDHIENLLLTRTVLLRAMIQSDW